MNKIIVSGNIVRDAELRFTPQGTPVVEFSIGIRDDLLKKRENRSVFINIVLFGKRAEILHKYLTKGKSVMTEGRLDIKINKNPDGRTFTNIQIYANSLEFLGKKETGEIHGSEQTIEENTDYEVPEEENN